MNRFICSWCLISSFLLTAGCHQYETVRVQVLDRESGTPVAGADVRTAYAAFADFRGVAEGDDAQTDSDGLAALRADLSKATLRIEVTHRSKVGQDYFGYISGDVVREWVLRSNDSTTPVDPLVGYIKRQVQSDAPLAFEEGLSLDTFLTRFSEIQADLASQVEGADPPDLDDPPHHYFTVAHNDSIVTLYHFWAYSGVGYFLFFEDGLLKRAYTDFELYPEWLGGFSVEHPSELVASTRRWLTQLPSRGEVPLGELFADATEHIRRNVALDAKADRLPLTVEFIWMLGRGETRKNHMKWLALLERFNADQVMLGMKRDEVEATFGSDGVILGGDDRSALVRYGEPVDLHSFSVPFVLVIYEQDRIGVHRAAMIVTEYATENSSTIRFSR